jgi:hypothetical protein
VKLLDGIIVSAVAETAGVALEGTDTRTGPVAAPGGTTKLRLVPFALVIGHLRKPPSWPLIVTSGVEPKFVPFTVTRVPDGPLVGEKLVMVGAWPVPAVVMFNAACRVKVSPFCLINRSRLPAAAALSITIPSVSPVDELAVTESTLTPAPRLAVTWPAAKAVASAVTAKVSDWPAAAVLGVTDSRRGAGATLNPFGIESDSVPVTTVTFLAPGLAVGEIVIVAVMLVGLATVTLFAATPGPISTLLTPEKKFE